MAEAGVVAGPSYDASDLVRDEHVAAHNMIVAIERPDGGDPIHVVGNPVKLSGSPEPPAERWPTLGRDTDEILERDLGMTPAERAALREQGAIS